MSHNFLVVRKKTYVDQAFEAAIPKVPAIKAIKEDLTTDPITDAQIAVPAVPAVPEVQHKEHTEVVQCFLENDPAKVAQHLADPDARPGHTYYSIVFDKHLEPQIKTVRKKSRVAAPAKETFTIEDEDGNELGSTEI